MSPEFVENYNNNEAQQGMSSEKYLDIERGDIDPMQLQSNQAQNQLTQMQQQQASQQVDPVQFVKNMISAGFTPTAAQITTAASNLTGPSDSTNTWFSIFLQKLMRQNKSRKK